MSIHAVSLIIFCLILLRPSSKPIILENAGRVAFLCVFFISWIAILLGIDNISGVAGARQVISHTLLSCVLIAYTQKPYWILKYLASLGYILNTTVILANNLRMPVDAEATIRMVKALFVLPQLDGYHVIIASGGRLPWLSDWIYHPLIDASAVVSIGDVLTTIGYTFTLVQILFARLRRS